MSEPLVSVVIPAYNAEATLERMFRSVFSQSWKALQIILVDDGSTDRTAEIARKMAEEDDRLTVISRKGAGVSAARNAALPLCEGKYIRFVDADDTLPPGSIESMVRRMEKDGTEMLVAGFTEYIGSKGYRKNLADLDGILDWEAVLRHLNPHSNSYFYGVLWNKLFLRELVEADPVRFCDGLTFGEDFAFNADYLSRVNHVSYMKDTVYDYRRNPRSMTVRQVFDCILHPIRNSRVKMELYRHLKELYVRRGVYDRYRRVLWLYLLRVGLNQ